LRVEYPMPWKIVAQIADCPASLGSYAGTSPQMVGAWPPCENLFRP
jgi:hypothetical protein